jgi:hypothetical protein
MRPLHPLLALCLLCISVFPASSQSQQQRSDPADVGTGPSSKAPGEMSYEAPKSPATTNARGETTTSSGASAPHSNTTGDAGSDRREDSKATKGGPEE